MRKATKKAAKKRQRVPRTRAGNTMTESQFWQFIRSNLRLATRKWPPKNQCRKSARRPSKRKDKRIKWEYQCADCKKWWLQKETQVDHIVEAGTLKAFEDLPGFVERLFCEEGGLQVLCLDCHKKKKHGNGSRNHSSNVPGSKS